VICANLAEAEGFVLPDFYEQHGIVSTVNVVIQGSSNGDAPYGILEIDSPEPREYHPQDVSFLTGFANVLAEAVATAQRMEKLHLALAEKEVLSRELQHRVRNNLHLIHAMLNMEAQNLPAAEQSFRTIANRVQALAGVYDHLLGTGLARSIAFNQYLEKLCETLRRFQPGAVELVHQPTASVMVDLDTATAMGIAITELITNSYKHAFPGGKGKILRWLWIIKGRHPCSSCRTTVSALIRRSRAKEAGWVWCGGWSSKSAPQSRFAGLKKVRVARSSCRLQDSLTRHRLTRWLQITIKPSGNGGIAFPVSIMRVTTSRANTTSSKRNGFGKQACPAAVETAFAFPVVYKIPVLYRAISCGATSVPRPPTSCTSTTASSGLCCSAIVMAS
jgi:two-component sensor histidine kinase